MNFQHRINLLFQLADYFKTNDTAWQQVKEKAERENGWFIQDFINLAVENILNEFLDPGKLAAYTGNYQIPLQQTNPSSIGLVMAGNIPLVGFHDWLCIYLSGHRAVVKPSSKDEVLIRHIAGKLVEFEPSLEGQTIFAPILKGCNAYIATGSNNSARYFDYYFKKYPHIIRRNRTSVAILDGKESSQQMEALADDISLFFGLGCRNVTRLFVPKGYEFLPLLDALRKYNYFFDHNKYKNNYDYQLALQLLNNKYYMTNGSVLLIENESVFSPISQLNYSFYDNYNEVLPGLQNNQDIQCVMGNGFVPFGQAQRPRLSDFADGMDTMKFLLSS